MCSTCTCWTNAHNDKYKNDVYSWQNNFCTIKSNDESESVDVIFEMFTMWMMRMMSMMMWWTNAIRSIVWGIRHISKWIQLNNDATMLSRSYTCACAYKQIRTDTHTNERSLSRTHHTHKHSNEHVSYYERMNRGNQWSYNSNSRYDFIKSPAEHSFKAVLAHLNDLNGKKCKSRERERAERIEFANHRNVNKINP